MMAARVVSGRASVCSISVSVALFLSFAVSLTIDLAVSPYLAISSRAALHDRIARAVDAIGQFLELGLEEGDFLGQVLAVMGGGIAHDILLGFWITPGNAAERERFPVKA
jgi:hypothetical protein